MIYFAISVCFLLVAFTVAVFGMMFNYSPEGKVGKLVFVMFAAGILTMIVWLLMIFR